MALQIKLTGLLLLALVTSGCIREQQPVSFRNQVQPILVANCVECHSAPAGKGYLKNGLSMATYTDLMRGTIYGPVITPGDSRHSILNMLVEGRADSSMRMPHGRTPLTSQEVHILRLWTEQGALPN